MSDPRRPLSQDEERQFQTDMATKPGYSDWIKDFYGRYGEKPNLNDPSYDYRTAWRYGVEPTPHAPDGGAFHWPSQVQPPPRAAAIPLKAPDHPTMWKQDFMSLNGVDPDTVSPAQLTEMLKPMAHRDIHGPNAIADLFLPKMRP